MPIIDAQVHLWRKGTPTPPHLATPYLVEDAIRGMDEAGVDGAILHPPASWDPDSNEQTVEATLAYTKRFAILGYSPLNEPDSRLDPWALRHQGGLTDSTRFMTAMATDGANRSKETSTEHR